MPRKCSPDTESHSDTFCTLSFQQLTLIKFQKPQNTKNLNKFLIGIRVL